MSSNNNAVAGPSKPRGRVIVQREPTVDSDMVDVEDLRVFGNGKLVVDELDKLQV